MGKMYHYYMLIFLLGISINFSICYAEDATNEPKLTESIRRIPIPQNKKETPHRHLKTPRILNGDLAEERNHRYLVAVMRLFNDVPVLQCGGAIIHRRYILTAAHCVYQYRSSDLVIRHGGVCGTQNYTPQNEERVFYKVAKVFIPRVYSATPCRKHQNDIAIIKVQEAFDLTDTSRFAKVNLPEYDADFDGYSTIVTGYGPDFGPLVEQSQRKNRYLQYVVKLRAMPSVVIPNEDCQFMSDVVVTEGNVCVRAVNPEAQTCFEDDGGPLVHDGTIVGILNDRKCDYNVPEMFTRVSSFLHFIKTVLEHQQTYDVTIL